MRHGIKQGSQLRVYLLVYDKVRKMKQNAEKISRTKGETETDHKALLIVVFTSGLFESELSMCLI